MYNSGVLCTFYWSRINSLLALLLLINKCVYMYFGFLNFREVLIFFFSEIKGKNEEEKRKKMLLIYLGMYIEHLVSCHLALPVSRASVMNVHRGLLSWSFKCISTINSLKEKQTFTHVSL